MAAMPSTTGSTQRQSTQLFQSMAQGSPLHPYNPGLNFVELLKHEKLLNSFQSSNKLYIHAWYCSLAGNRILVSKML